MSYEEGKALADKYKLPFYEASAKTGENIEKIFSELGKTVKDKLFDLEKDNNKKNDDNKINITTITTEKHL